MKRTAKIISIYICIVLSLISVSFFTIGCSDEYEYNPNYSAYDGVTLSIDLVDQNNVLSLNLINETYTLKVNVNPESIIIDPKGFIYEIADETIATINNEGLLTMLKDGETELTVKFRGNPEVSTKCTLKIQPILTEKLNLPEEIIVEEEKTINLSEKISTSPSEASQKFNYQVEDKSIAIINEEGIVTGLKEGETKIIVTTTDGTNLSGEVKLIVLGKIYINEIQFPDDMVNGKNFITGQVLNIAKFVNILPSNASEPIVKYSVTSGENVVSVTEDGNINCLVEGEATIKIEAMDNNPNPISAKELKIKVVTNGWYERAFWTIDTSYRFDSPQDDLGEINYTYDKNDKANGPAEKIIDNNNNSFFMMVKPGKNYNGYENPFTEHFFIIDMGSSVEFNKVKWRHRSGNSANFKVYNTTLYGSNDGKEFTLIQENIDLSKGNEEQIINVPSSSYRYIKAMFNSWNTSSGSNMCIAEFNVCKE